MAWITPKTNWRTTDPVQYTDFNRIKNNLESLFRNDQYVSYGNIHIIDDMTSYSQDYKVDDFNAIEEMVDILDRAYSQDFGPKKTFYANGTFIDYVELNRIEGATKTMHDLSPDGSTLTGYLIYTTSGNTMTVTGMKVNEIVQNGVTELRIPTELYDYNIAF